jgi:thymidine kinase
MLTVIAGGMFSEKTTELQRRGKRLTRAGKKVIYFKPDFDNRYSENEIVSHDGKRVPAYNLPTVEPHMLFNEEYKQYEVILIDEIQFFPSVIVTIIEILLKQGKTVIVAGLDLDFEAKPFTVTSQLMAIAEDVVKLKAVCSECGTDSWVSYKEPNGKRIELGTNEYKPLCRTCFYNKQLEDEK